MTFVHYESLTYPGGPDVISALRFNVNRILTDLQRQGAKIKSVQYLEPPHTHGILVMYEVSGDEEIILR